MKMEQSAVFDETCRRYLDEVARLDLSSHAGILGIRIDGGTAIIPFFNTEYRVSGEGITDPAGNRPLHSVSIVLLKYLILCPEVLPEERQWVAYRDFRDSVPFVGAFSNNTENVIAATFSGNVDALADACRNMGGRPPDEKLQYDMALQIDVLPRIPMLILFNDADAEFAAQCRIIFDRRAEKFLDMECMPVVAWLFTDVLVRKFGKRSQII